MAVSQLSSLSLSAVGRKKRAFFGDGNRANYLVVKTDYTSYSVVYNCNPVGAILKKGTLSLIETEIHTFPITMISKLIK